MIVIYFNLSSPNVGMVMIVRIMDYAKVVVKACHAAGKGKSMWEIHLHQEDVLAPKEEQIITLAS